MLSQEQRKWIEDNCDLVDWAVTEYADIEDEDERDEIRSCASLLMCEFINDLEHTADLKVFCKLLFKHVLPLQRDLRRLKSEIESSVYDDGVSQPYVKWEYYEE